MGKVILCAGRLAEKPFIIEGSDRKIYSIEELNYFVVENIYGIDLGFFNEELFHFIETELFLPEVSEGMRKLIQNGSGLTDLVTALLCASDLYDKEEILGVISILGQIFTMDNWEKRAHLGYQHLKEGRYLSALGYFRGILKEERISEKDYGLILMAMGVCLIHTSSYKGAADCFYKAYMYGKTKENLIYTLLSLKLGGLSEEFKKKAGNLPEDDPILREVDSIWNAANERAKKGEAYQGLLKILDGMETTGGMENIDKELQSFKKEYREGLKHGLI